MFDGKNTDKIPTTVFLRIYEVRCCIPARKCRSAKLFKRSKRRNEILVILAYKHKCKVKYHKLTAYYPSAAILAIPAMLDIRLTSLYCYLVSFFGSGPIGDDDL